MVSQISEKSTSIVYDKNSQQSIQFQISKAGINARILDKKTGAHLATLENIALDVLSTISRNLPWMLENNYAFYWSHSQGLTCLSTSELFQKLENPKFIADMFNNSLS